MRKKIIRFFDDSVQLFSTCLLNRRIQSVPHEESVDSGSTWTDGGVALVRPPCTCNGSQQQEGSSDISDSSMPLMSQTPSSVCPASPIHQEIFTENPDRLDDVDGLPVIHCDVQLRVQQIITESKVHIRVSKKKLPFSITHLFFLFVHVFVVLSSIRKPNIVTRFSGVYHGWDDFVELGMYASIRKCIPHGNKLCKTLSKFKETQLS